MIAVEESVKKSLQNVKNSTGRVRNGNAFAL
jgi:hypothetical protein